LIDGVEYLRLAASPPAVSFQTVLTSINLGPDLPAMVPLAARLGVARVALMPVYVRHLSREEKLLLPSAAQLERLRTEYLPEMLQTGARLGVEVQVDGGDADDIEPMSTVTETHAPRISAGGDHSRGYYQRHACYLPWYHCTIDHRGDVFACCHMRNEDGLMGNITDSSLCDILQSGVARGLRERLKTDDVPPSCQECSMQISENQAIDRMLQD
jgi:radical SAM protein with 4Fe4S-binding SPASM domain